MFVRSQRLLSPSLESIREKGGINGDKMINCDSDSDRLRSLHGHCHGQYNIDYMFITTYEHWRGNELLENRLTPAISVRSCRAG